MIDDDGAATAAPTRLSTNLNTDQPHSARIYDYFLDGKDNFPADRAAAEHALVEFPHARITARENRAFMHRAVRFLAGEVGIRQFLDVGTGIPTSPNLHEIAQGVAPEARVVYVDNDPLVLVHARALLTSTPQGRTEYVAADLRDPAAILGAPELLGTLDLSRPVALSLVAIFHFIADEEDPYGIVRRLIDHLPSGSCLVLTHGTADFDPQAEALTEAYRKQGVHAQTRTREQVTRFFDGLDLIDPGVQIVHRWRPDDRVAGDLTDAQVSIYGAVGRKR